ncbi:hypothetical protein TIFTF001_022621 [Ficus carica]|uniref:C2H2-type domain-containing protein n=1 Tax=Ficus carica TaxID=3494 RepID=A0AA88AW10_FICCA|nr:hypothetical protein TIFTF001_022621 [Ficus carica]
MESGKQGVSCSETASSEENERSEQVNREETSAAKRSYECTYCKRGFTNAQALGGHMNIHRKDRAKSKQHNPVSSLSNYHQSEEIHMAVSSHHFTNYSPFSNQLPAWYPPAADMEAQRNYHHNMHFQPISGYSNFDSNYINPFANSRASPTTPNLTMNEELMAANLSLQIDSSDLEDRDATRGSAVLDHDEVDLELRLGHG